MPHVADREKDCPKPAAVVHFHILGLGIRDGEKRKKWLSYHAFPTLAGRLNEKYKAGIDPEEFGRHHYVAGWFPDIASDSFVLEKEDRIINITLRTLKLDQKGQLKVVFESEPLSDSGQDSLDCLYGLKHIGDEFYAVLKRYEKDYPHLDILYKDITFGTENIKKPRFEEN